MVVAQLLCRDILAAQGDRHGCHILHREYVGCESLVRADKGELTTWLQTLAPRIPLVVMAALTDYYTSLLATRLIGPAAQSTAVRILLSSCDNLPMCLISFRPDVPVLDEHF